MRSRYKRQLIQLKMSKKWPTWSGMEDPRPIFSCKRFSYIADFQKMAVAERREAEPTTERRNEVGLAVRQATIKLLAESGRQ